MQSAPSTVSSVIRRWWITRFTVTGSVAVTSRKKLASSGMRRLALHRGSDEVVAQPHLRVDDRDFRVLGSPAWTRARLILAALALLAAGCQDDDDRPSGLPAAVAETRSQILDAAESGDYDQLPRLLNDENLAAWRQRAPNRSRRWRSSSACPIRFGRRTRARSTSGRGTVRIRSPGDVGIRPRALPAGDDRGRGQA